MKEHTNWSSTQIIGMSHLITSKEDDARATRCFVEQFPDLDGTYARNNFRNISTPVFDLLVIKTILYASQKNYNLFIVSFSKIQNFVGLIILSPDNNRRYFRDYWSKSKNLKCRALTETMRRSKIRQMKSYIHMWTNDSLRPQKKAKDWPI